MISKSLGLIFCLAILASVAPLSAQQVLPEETPADSFQMIRPQPISNIDGLDKAQRLMQLGDYARAADLLESILEKSPPTPMLLELLTTCYEQSKNYSKLIIFLKRRAGIEPPGFPLYRDLGRAYMLSGFPDSATAYFYKAAETADNKERAFSIIADIYYKFGQYHLEQTLIDSARALTADPRLLPDRMGDALAAQRQFGAAALEYLAYMEKDSIAAANGEEQLISLMRYPESADTVMAVLAGQIASRKENTRLQNIYGQLLMEQDKFGEAFEYFRGRDSLQSGSGSDILYFMQECNRRKKYEYTLEAGKYFVSFHERSPLQNSAQFVMAEADIGMGRYDDALAAYQEIAADFIRPAHRAEANLDIGLLYKDHLGDMDKAREYLNEVVRSVPGGPYAIQAQQALADIAIREHNLDLADSLYASLMDLELPPDVAEQTEFGMAEVSLFKGNFTDAAKRFRQIISRYPRGFYVNDAIQYSLIISETLDDAPKQIDLFASAEYFRYVKETDSLESYLTKICRVGIPSLAPISYVHLAELYKDQNRNQDATDAVDSLQARFPDSYFLPYGLKLKADIYMQSSETQKQALAMYRDLLEKYPTYPFVAEIRNIVRRETPGDRI